MLPTNDAQTNSAQTNGAQTYAYPYQHITDRIIAFLQLGRRASLKERPLHHRRCASLKKRPVHRRGQASLKERLHRRRRALLENRPLPPLPPWSRNSSPTPIPRDEFDDCIRSQENNKNYVDAYRRKYCNMCRINRLSLMVFGDSRAGKTRLVDRLTNTTRSESENREPLRIVECAVSKKEMGITWYIPKEPFHQRVWYEFDARFPGGSNQNNVPETPAGISDLEVKIWDVSGDCGAYNSHKVFLSPSGVYLLVVNARNSLHEVPEGGSRQHTWSPLESLDHWLHMIDMCASHDKNGSHSECAIIVLTHTDLIDEDQRERKIQEYKKQILEHVQSRHTCKYVHPTVFALGDDSENHNELYCLQQFIVEKFESDHCEGADVKPWSYLKLEADILEYFADEDKRYLSSEELVSIVTEEYGTHRGFEVIPSISFALQKFHIR